MAEIQEYPLDTIKRKARKMKVKDAIKDLKRIDPEDEIVIAWWAKEDFFVRPAWHAHQHDNPTGMMEATKKEWEDVVHIGDDMDWSMTHETLKEVMEMELQDLRKQQGYYKK